MVAEREFVRENKDELLESLLSSVLFSLVALLFRQFDETLWLAFPLGDKIPELSRL